MLAVVGKSRDPVIHAHTYAQLEGLQQFGEYYFHAPAEREGLWGISLRKQKGKLIAADAKCGVRCAQSFPQRDSNGTQDFITARMAVPIVDLLEAVHVENDEAEREAIAAGAIEFFFERFAKEPRVGEAGERIGDGVHLQFFQFIAFRSDRDAELTSGGQHVHEGGL